MSSPSSSPQRGGASEGARGSLFLPMTIGESTVRTTGKSPVSPIGELRAYLVGFAARCRAARWFGAVFHVGVISDIAADVQAAERRAADAGYAIEQSELIAAAEIRAFEADRDEAHLRRAARIVARDAERGREISEVLA